MNKRQPDKDIIIRTMDELKLLEEILADQLNQQKYYTSLIFYSTTKQLFNSRDFNNFIILSSDSINPVLHSTFKDIFDRTSTCIDSYPSLLTIKHDNSLTHETSIWRLNDPWHPEELELNRSDLKKNIKPGEILLRYDNDDFIMFCFEISKHLQAMFPEKSLMRKKQPPSKKSVSFPDYLITTDPSDKVILAEHLRNYLTGAQGKRIACVLQALHRINKIDLHRSSLTKLYIAIRDYFDLTSGCSDQVINRYNKPDIWKTDERRKEYDDVTGEIGKFIHDSIIN